MMVVIAVILGETAARDSNTSRKALVLAVQHGFLTCSLMPEHVMHMQKNTTNVHFDDINLEDCVETHNDALVVSTSLSNLWVKMILVDSESSADLLFYDAFQQQGIDNV